MPPEDRGDRRVTSTPTIEDRAEGVDLVAKTIVDGAGAIKGTKVRSIDQAAAEYAAESAPQAVGSVDAAIAALDFDERYRSERLLGEGGMGTVALCLDRQIGRRVAMKRLRAERASQSGVLRRFIREARIQGQLEHPSLVPVYDLGVDPSGATFFTMKRVRGVTLEAVIDGLAHRDEAFTQSHTRRRLLSAFSRACLAIDFAHRRGVLHRDLKPSNIMLGDYGEVYILDWGLAGLDPSRDELDQAGEPDLDVEPMSGDGRETSPGKMFGTPGYGSPEQLRGELDRLGPTTDVYALGAILYEILCLAYLHPRRSVGEILASTFSGALARPSIRAPERDVPPELEEVLVRATALSPSDRYQSARELHDVIETFLDGERDIERRRALAEEHAEAARALAKRARAGEAEVRALAFKEVGRALTFDPESSAALEVLRRLLIEPPEEVPDDLREEVNALRGERYRWMSRIGSVSYSALLLYVPLLLYAGVRDWLPIAAFGGLLAASCAVSLWVWRQPRPSLWLVDLVMVMSNLSMAMTATFFGPLLVAPAVIAINTTPYALYLPGFHRWLAIATAAGLTVGLIALGALGLLPGGYTFTGDALIIHAGAIRFDALSIQALLIATGVGHVITNTVVISRIQADLQRAEEQLLTHLWHLKNLAPTTGTEALEGLRAKS